MSLDDRLAIQQQIAAYSYTFDSGNADGWAELFTEDCIWEYVIPGNSDPTVCMEGRQALRDFCNHQFTNRTPGLFPLHHQSGTHFDALTSDIARTQTMVIVTTQKPGETPGLFLTGVYRDDWVKQADGWKIKRRTLTH